MSALILPARSLLKPDRAWDVPGPRRPRARSRWWRQLLGARFGVTRLQPGACCGCGGSSPCTPCAIPTTNLAVDWDFPPFTGASFIGTGSGTLVYTAGATFPWLMSCVVNGTANNCFNTYVSSSVAIAFRCGPSEFSFSFNTTCSNDPFCGQITYQFPASGSWTLTSYTCSPFSMTWTNVVDSGAVTLSITIHA